MGNLGWAYTSMEGRIGRRTWWIASIILIVVVLIVEFAILPLVGLNMMANMAALTGGDAAAAAQAISDSMHRAGWIGLVIYLIIGYPTIALGLKRRHDRDNNGVDFLVFYVVALLINIATALGLGYTTMDLGNGVVIPTPSLPLNIINILFLIFAIYLLVVMGFLKGSTGSNQYGPDPLLAGSPQPA